MPPPKKEKERERFYLFPGMGGRASSRKNKIILRWSLIAGLIVSVILGVALYLSNKRF